MNEDGTSQASRMKVTQVAFYVSLFVMCAGCLFLLCGGIATARNARERVECQNILKTLFAELEFDETGLNHHEIKSHLEKLITNSYGNPSRHSGPNSDTTEAFIFSPRVSFLTSLDEPPSIMVCDKPGNHVIYLGNGLRERRDGRIQEQAMLLLSNGRIIVWQGDSTEYKKWVADFIEGKGESFPPGIDRRFKLSNEHTDTVRW